MKRQLAAVLVALTAGVLVPATSQAAIAVTGSDLSDYRSTANAGEIVAFASWDGVNDGNKVDNGFRIAWNITNAADINGFNWTYSYTISGADGSSALSKDLSHWILQISNDTTIADFKDFSSSPASGDPSLYTDISNGNSDPNLPTPPGIFGLKFDPLAVTFKSTKEPVWGNFYAIDGKNTSPPTSAMNPGLTTNTLPDALTTDFSAWIAVPDGSNFGGGQVPGETPEPATLVMWSLLGAIAVGVTRLRRRRQAG